MQYFINSSNSRFFLEVNDQNISLYKEEKILWKRNVPFKKFRPIGLGNNGVSALITEEGIFIFPVSSDPPQLLSKYSPQSLSRTSSSLGFCKMDNRGDRICLEKITAQGNISDRIFKLLSSPSTESFQVLHEVVFYDLRTGTERTFYKQTSDGRIPDSFMWNISRDFEFMAACDTKKTPGGKTSTISIIHVPIETILFDFAVYDSDISLLIINNEGTVLTDLSQGEIKQFLIISAQGEKNIVSPIPNYRILNLGRNYVALHSKQPPVFMTKSFDDSVIHNIDLEPLEHMVEGHHILFNERDDLDLVLIREGLVKIMHSNVENFSIDAKRWDLISRQQAAVREKEREKPLEEAKTQAYVLKKRSEKIMALQATASRQLEEKRKKHSGELKTAISQMEKLELKKLTGAIDDETHNAQKAGLESRLFTLQGQEISPRVETDGLKIPPSPPPPSLDATAHRHKIEKILERLEERFISSEISEKTYLELKEKYENRLKQLGS